MTPQTKRARQGCSPHPAHLPHKFGLNKELIVMLHINSQSGKTASSSSNNNQSPWITQRERHIFGYELSIAEDHTCHSFMKPHPLFAWIHANKLNATLFDVLAKLCPLHPVISYRGQTALWLSNPPSGSGNTVGIIIGRDKSNRLRIIGTNFMNSPTRSSARPTQCIFDAYDSLSDNDLKIYRLIENEISARMTSNEIKIAAAIEHEAFKYRTMPIYILVIDGEHSYLAIDTAMVSGNYPSDMSYEFAGELV